MEILRVREEVVPNGEERLGEGLELRVRSEGREMGTCKAAGEMDPMPSPVLPHPGVYHVWRVPPIFPPWG